MGDMLRWWREQRRFSQQELSNLSSVSTRHLSRVETGRARPTPEMIDFLAENLDVPL
ncbi:XRE family transcriptional regulator, partial [Burkholderia multivorans]